MRALLIPIAAAAMLAVAAGCTPGSPDASPTTTRSVSPSAAEPSLVPDGPLSEALLTAEDVGEGYVATQILQGDDHGAIGMLMAFCGQAEYSEAGQHVVDYVMGSVGRDDQEYVLVALTRYADDTWAQRHLDDLRVALPRCAQVPVMGNLDDTAALTVVDNDFAGDGSVLVQEERGGVTQYHAVVRQGEVEARLRIHTSATQDQARDLAATAAGRLCRAAASC
jgi:hypothetical protein